MVGRVIGNRYRLEEQIGAGGMGVVWRAADTVLNRPVAIKCLRLDQAGSDSVDLVRQRTLREARIAAQLHHPNIVSIFDVLEVDGDPWLVLEYLPSESLSDIVDRGTLSPQQAARIGIPIADALAFAHSAGITHRDVKPANILIGAAGQIKLTDFGISHSTGDVRITRTGMMTGTPAYLAPEIARGEPGSNASDVYSLGATLYAAVEGAPPFADTGDNLLLLVRLIGSTQVPPPQRAGPLTPILARLMDINPAGRPPAGTAGEMLRSLAPADAGPTRTITANPPPPPWPQMAQSPPQPRRRRGLVVAGVIIGALALLSALTAGVVTLAGSRAPGESALGPQEATLGVEPRTADPCSLVAPTALAQFGDAYTAADLGSFSECQLEVYFAEGGYATVRVDFYQELAPNEALPGVAEVQDGLTVGREKPASTTSCRRIILLRDRHQVYVTADLYDGATADVCAIADTATTAAVQTLTSKGIGERRVPSEKGSLALLDGCALLDPAALMAAGVPASGSPDYANWYCSWGTQPIVAVYLLRAIERNIPGSTAATIAGRTVFTVPSTNNAAPSCSVDVQHRRFTASDGAQRIEVLEIQYAGAGTIDEMCRIANALAANAIPKLPPVE